MIKIALIDTGCELLEFNKDKIKGFYELENNKITNKEISYDSNGHGTACAYIINKMCQEYELYVYKIFSDKLVTKSQYLIKALEHCISQNYNFINLSLGLISNNNLDKLQEICLKLTNNNCHLICAGSEDDIKCWPSEFPFVIKVLGETISTKNIYSQKNSYNVLYAYSGEQKAIWKQGKYNIVYGTSFACARVTGFLAQCLINNPDESFETIIKQLPEMNSTQFSSFRLNNLNTFGWAKNVLVFPFNKEMHSIVRFESNVSFQIRTVVDLPLLGNVGKNVNQVLLNCNSDYIIQGNYKKALDDKIDTVLLGDLSELSKVYNTSQVIKYSQIAFEAGKNVISIELLDNDIYMILKDKAKQLNCNFICLNDILHPDVDCQAPNIRNTVPVLSVLGTGPKVGKFTFQMDLKNTLENLGYKISNICTEPQAFLFGLNTVPLGNLNLINKISFHRQINYIKNMIYTINHFEKPELIMIGGQSGVIPFSPNINVDFTSLSSILTILSSKADGYILCINFEDSIEYIKRTISAIEAFGYGKVFVCAISSMSKQISRQGSLVFEKKFYYSSSDILDRTELLEKYLNIPIVNMMSQDGCVKCVKAIQQYFSKRG